MTTVSPAATRYAASPSVLQEALPVYDMVLTEHRVVEAEVDTLFATARDFDFMTVRSPLVTAMMTRPVRSRVGAWCRGAVTAASSESVAERVSSLSRTDGSAPATPEQDGWCSDDTGGRLNW